MNTGQVWWELLSEKFLEAFEKRKEEGEKMTNSCSLEMELRLLETKIIRGLFMVPNWGEG